MVHTNTHWINVCACALPNAFGFMISRAVCLGLNDLEYNMWVNSNVEQDVKSFLTWINFPFFSILGEKVIEKTGLRGSK